MKEAFRRLPWIEVLSLCVVLGAHLFFAVSIINGNVLYLGGDTTREAWRALTLLDTGRLTREFSVPFESDLYCLVIVPFIVLFKNTVLTLQIASVTFTAATVAVLYAYLRRAYGLLAAFCVGMIYAVSPLLLAHTAFNPEYSIPLYIGVIILLETVRSPYAPHARSALAGFFASLHPYFLFPYFGYLAGKIDKRVLSALKESPKAALKALGRHALLFLAGLSPLLFKIAAVHVRESGGLARWTESFVYANVVRWQDIPAILYNTATQLSWSISSFTVYGAVNTPALLTPLLFLWLFLWAVSFSVKGPRRWAVTLAAGIIPAGLVASPAGLGMRHLLAFLPFFWLMLPPLFSKFDVKRGKLLICLVAAIAIMYYVPVNISFRLNAAPEGAAVLRDTDHVSRLLASSPGKEASLYSDNSNFFFDLKYLVPEKDLRLFDDISGLPPRTALLILGAPPSGREKLFDLGTYRVSGRTICKVFDPRR